MGPPAPTTVLAPKPHLQERTKDRGERVPNLPTPMDARTGEQELHLRGLHTSNIYSVVFSADGALLALGSDDKIRCSQPQLIGVH